MLEWVKKTIDEYNMLTPGERVVLGVSGGADSIALLHILYSLKNLDLNITVAHLNHSIRGEEADRDAAFVEKAASDLGVGFISKKVDTLSYKEEQKLSLEDAARELRYMFFDEVRHSIGASKVATAHTLDDQAETVLMRLIRGSGLRGLSGIAPVSRGYLIRPLLFISRSEIEQYLKESGINWVEDSSNISAEFLRNRIRHNLIPILREYNPRITETLARTSDILRADDEFISSESRKIFGELFAKYDDSEMIGDLNIYRNTAKSLRLSCLRLSIERSAESLEGVSYTHITAADQFLLSDTASGEIELPGDKVISKGYDKFIVTTNSALKHEFSYSIDSPGEYSFNEFKLSIQPTAKSTYESKDESTAYFSESSIEFPIEVRTIKPGDKFKPLGMSSFKKVQDYFTDIKLPKFMRNRVPIFLSKGEIFWVGGMRIDERSKVRAKEDKAIKFKLDLSARVSLPG